MPEKTEFKKAREAVEDYLKINDFIEIHKEQIYNKLETSDDHAQAAGPEGDMVFIAESFPLISGIMHVGSTLECFREATKWVKKELPEAEPVSVLSALTFIYIVEKGYQENVDSGRQDIWKRILRRVTASLL